MTQQALKYKQGDHVVWCYDALDTPGAWPKDAEIIAVDAASDTPYYVRLSDRRSLPFWTPADRVRRVQ